MLPQKYFILTYFLFVVGSYLNFILIDINLKTGRHSRQKNVGSSITNYLLDEDDDKSKIDWTSVTIQEIVALGLPLICVTFLSMGVIASFLNLNEPYMTYAAILPEWRNWWVIGTLVFIDMITALTCLFPLPLMAFNTLLFLEKSTQQISKCVKLIDGKLGTGEVTPFHLIHSYRSCRILHALVSKINGSCAVFSLYWNDNYSAVQRDV
ncbi:unnamed protein product [Allacma fusca]|uniref:Uncharacterized protein n=1 Tax=Allacma fusca TaxID=39272 RepID=A0A8J2JXN8_9HEXA|nr:unnamed protein product [Allacma fusca]